MNLVDFYDCYSFHDEWYLVEMLLNVPSSQIDWSGIVVPENGVDKSDWQCPYMEQYLNSDGTAKICDTYEVPKGDMCPCRIAFFIYKTNANILRTPYGDFELGGSKKVPARLKGMIEFE